jgi:hypothetical protein
MKGILALGFCLLLSSCATLFSKSEDEVRFKTSPPGATVYLDGDEVGVTPFTLVVRRKMATHQVTIKKEGYESQTFTLMKSLTPASFFNCTSLLSWGTDALTGKMFEYSPNSYFVDLAKKGRMSDISGEALRFIVMNHQAIIHDVSKGGGEYSLNLSRAHGIEHNHLIHILKKNIYEISGDNGIDVLREKIGELKKKAPLIAHH